MRTPIAWLVLVLLAVVGPAAANEPTMVDSLVLGDETSELGHDLTATRSDVVKGGLGQPARRLLPPESAHWEGGRFSFTMKVDPAEQTYLTARFWGGDVDPNLLILFCEGRQVGYRHLGDVEVLALPDDEPRYDGRAYYVTMPLPQALTKGKGRLRLEVRATGPIFNYAPTFDGYQKPMTAPTRQIQRLYTHTDGCFVPPADEPQGEAPPATRRPGPGPEVLRDVKERVNRTLSGMLRSGRPLNQMELQFLARAYDVSWTVAHRNGTVTGQVVKGVDALYDRWKKDPERLWQDPATWNPGWFGVGPAGDAVRRLAGPLGPSLGAKVDGETTRRDAWSGMFRASRDWVRAHRRWLTNQAMFTDVNLYLCDRAVAAIDPAHALPEEKARDYLDQAVGLVPWLGSDTDQGPERPLGDDFRQVTGKGLTRELGYVGGYGEVGVGGATEVYEATRAPGGEGDPKLKAQLAKMLRARGAFRYPTVDAEGHTAMRLETGVGWRDVHSPGPLVYAHPPDGDQSTLRAAAATLDPHAVGYVQQMFADNQFFASVADHLKDRRFRATVGLLGVPDEYELLKAQPASPHRLPMSWDQPDFVFSDEEDGVVAVKHGGEVLFVSLYWRSHYAVNSLARVHLLRPRYQQLAVVREDVRYEASGATYRRPDWINFGFGGGGNNIHYPRDLHQAYAGEEQPVARTPPGVTFKAGNGNPYAGRGEFYTLRFGPYLIGMNMTTGKTFGLKTPPGVESAPDLVSGRTLRLDAPVEVGPRRTIVLHLGP